MSNTRRNPVRVVVLGAGLAGLSAADYLTEQGVEVLVLEKDDHPGGLAATFRSGAFHYDCGPHRFHTENPEILKHIKELLHTEMFELNRLSRIRLLDRYFQYPLALSNVLQKMPLHRGLSMVLSYLWERFRNPFFSRDESNFENWVVKRFGRQLYNIYFGPYTEKLWGCNASELSADWASQRITVPSLTSLVKETLFPSRDTVRSLVSTFHYPRGGIGKICEALDERIKSRDGKILYEIKLLSIRKNLDSKFVMETDHGEITTDTLINTIPVTDYVHLLGDLLSAEVREAASKLHFRAIVFLIVKLRNRVEARDHWIYTPEECYLFNRLSIPENFDPECSGKCSQIVFEFSCKEGDDIWNGNIDLDALAVSGGEKLGLFKVSDVVGTALTRQSHAYPLYDLGYSSNTSIVLDALNDLEDSVTCGRQGLFRYNNMDHSIEMGQCAAREILGSGSVAERFAWTTDTWADG